MNFTQTKPNQPSGESGGYNSSFRPRPTQHTSHFGTLGKRGRQHWHCSARILQSHCGRSKQYSHSASELVVKHHGPSGSALAALLKTSLTGLRQPAPAAATEPSGNMSSSVYSCSYCGQQPSSRPRGNCETRFRFRGLVSHNEGQGPPRVWSPSSKSRSSPLSKHLVIVSSLQLVCSKIKQLC